MSDTEKKDEGQYWATELAAARRRERSWRRQADQITKLYEADRVSENSFNILYANTDTLLPACYNQLPRALVERRFRDADPLSKASAEVLQRTLQYSMETNSTEFDSFHSLIQQAVLGALVPGRGITRFYYEPKIKSVPEPVGDEEADGEEGGSKEAEATPIHPDKPAVRESVEAEVVYGEDFDYSRVLFGPGKTWTKLPWVAFEHSMTEEDLEANFGKGVVEKHEIPLTKGEKKRAGEEAEEQDEEEADSTPTATVYEIWHKPTKTVIFVCETAAGEKLLKTLEDPLELSGFYPCPRPLQFMAKKSKFTPTPLYKLYEQQAKELNRLTQRINRVLNAMKVRGFYDGTLQGLKELLTADDNTLLPAVNVAALQDGKNLQNSIWLMPLNELIAVLQQLIVGREQCKATIYEITGISDIMRGDTAASETFGAQNLKSQWGTMRLQRIQGMVQVYVRECLQIVAEIACKQFGLKTFAGMTNLPFALPEEVQQAKALMQQAQQMQMMMQSQMQQAAAAGQQMQPPQIPPQIQQMLQQAQATLAKPEWEKVVGLLQDDVLRCYRVDIETNSTLNPRNKEQQEQMAAALQSLAQLFNAFGPVVQQGGLPVGALKQMTLAVCRRFEFGKEVEEALAKMPDQMPQGQDPKAMEAAKKQMEQAQQQIEQQTKMLEKAKMEVAAEKDRIKLDAEMAQQKLALKAQEAQMQLEGMIDKALLQIKELLGQHNTQVQSSLQQVQTQREVDASVEQRVEGVKRQQEEKVQRKQSQASEAKMLQAVQGILQGAQLTNQNIEAIMQQIAGLKQNAGPRKMSINWDDANNATVTQQ